ncbi:RNA 2',3'-cyclic phosphodiesterase [bacterium]|nr:RNA 2',3'-cyclic phosphodiesterase [bacterium]
MLNDSIRSFIALEIPAAIQMLIYRELIQKLKRLPVKVSWVKAENMHLTLKFLGDIQPQQVGGIGKSLENLVQGFEPLNLSTGSLGTFGSSRFPRVVWTGFSGEIDQLTNLANAVIQICARMGFPPEDRRFSPHLTLGRVRNPENGTLLLRKIEDLKVPVKEFQADRLVFMKSTLSPGGSIYEPLGEYILGGQ